MEKEKTFEIVSNWEKANTAKIPMWGLTAQGMISKRKAWTEEIKVSLEKWKESQEVVLQKIAQKKKEKYQINGNEIIGSTK